MRRRQGRFSRFRRLATALFEPADRDVTAAKVQLTATWLTGRRHHRLAVALLDLTERRLGPHGDITQLRRTIPGYVGRVSRRHVEAAARQASGTELTSIQVSDEPLTGGISPATVVVVRHTAQPHGHTFIRKSIHMTHPREVRLYRSGLASEPGRWFRAPAVLGIARQGKRWHLFLEDLRGGVRPKSAADFVNCARGLAELGARFYGEAAPKLNWLSMDPTFELPPYEPGIRACSQFLAPADGRRLLGLFDRLCAEEANLVAHRRSLPRTLCHGDAHAGNMIMDPTRSGRTVLIDWQMVHLGPVGHDLGKLMSVPSSFARGAQLDPNACLQAYLDQLGTPASDYEEVVFACDFVLVWHSLRWWGTRNQPNRGWLRPADVNRICQAAETLLSR
jgi:hypothetical protein